MTQTDLFKATRTMHGRLVYEPTFHGPDVTTKDHDRLTGLLARVATFMADGQFYTLAEIHRACGGTEASCSARLRQLANDYGYAKTRKRTTQPGLFVYRCVKP